MKIVTNKDFDCYDVAEMSGIKRGINIDGKTLEEIKSEAIKDFAKWLVKNVYLDCADCVNCFNCKEGTCVENLLKAYKKKQKGETE